MIRVCPFCRVRITEKTPNTVLVCAIPAHEECFKEHLKKHQPINISKASSRDCAFCGEFMDFTWQAIVVGEKKYHPHCWKLKEAAR